MGQRPKSKAKTVRLLEGSIGVNLCEFGVGNGFLDMTSKAQTTKWKKKTDKLDFSNVKHFFFLQKVHYQKSEKTTCRMGENTSKSQIC